MMQYVDTYMENKLLEIAELNRRLNEKTKGGAGSRKRRQQ